MKRLSVTLSALVGLALNVSAITFTGTFTGTPTSVTTPIFGFNSVADTLTGAYSYESATVDGAFTPDSGNLMVTINLPDTTTLTQGDDTLWPFNPTLTVAGGAVTGLNFIFLPNTETFETLLTTWKSRSGDLRDTLAEGTLSFSNPVEAPSNSVPDAGGSAVLLGLACVGLWSVRRYQTAA